MTLNLPKLPDLLGRSAIAERIVRGSLWSLGGALLSRGLGLIASVLVARWLGNQVFGEVCLIQNTVSTMGSVSALGLGITATKHIAACRRTDPARAGRMIMLVQVLSLVSSACVAGVLLMGSAAVVTHWLAAPQLDSAFKIGLLSLVPATLNGVQLAVLGGFEAFRTIARVNWWSGVATFGLVTGGALVGGLPGVLWANLATGVWTCWLFHRAIRAVCGAAGIVGGATGMLRELGVVWRFSLPAWLAGLMTGPVIWVAQMILVHQPRGYAELGIYGAVTRIKQIPETILTLALMPLLPILSEAYANRSRERCQATLRYAFSISVCIVAPISLIQIALPNATLAIFGPSYAGETAVVQWLMVHAIAVGLFQPFGSMLASANRMWFGWTYNLLWAALFLGGVVYWVPAYGAAGMAGALAGSHVVSSLLCVLYLYRYERELVAGLGLGTNLAAVAGCAGIVALGAYWLDPWPTLALGILATGALVWHMMRRVLRPWASRLVPPHLAPST